MSGPQANGPTPRVLCRNCWASILPLTADYTGGLCMPCFDNVAEEFRKEQSMRDPGVELKDGFVEMWAYAVLRYVGSLCKALDKNGVTYQKVPGKRLVALKGGPVVVETVRIFVHQKDNGKAEFVSSFHQPTNAIRNCKVGLTYVCPRDWDELEPTNEAATRFCQGCRKNVFFCANDIEALTHARQGHCIAMPGEDGTGRALIKVGMPPPLTEEQEVVVEAFCCDRAKTTALQSLTESSRFCRDCGYPLPEEGAGCRVCWFWPVRPQ